MNDISPLAGVSPASVLGTGIRIGPFAIIEEGVTVGDGCVIDGGAVLKTGTVLGAKVHVHHGAVIGGLPQDLSFDAATRTGVIVGENTTLREGVTISRATKPGESTRIGRGCLLMANAHVAHDGVLGDGVVLANGVLLAGHVRVGENAFLGGGAAVHQHVRVGTLVMCGGNATVTADIPPYCLAAGRNRVVGINLIGLRRRGVPRDAIAEVKAAYRAVYLAPGLNLVANAGAARDTAGFLTGEAAGFLDFFLAGGKRPSFARAKRGKGDADAE